VRCAYCGEDTSREWYDHKGRKISSFPFKCEYCGLVYCSEHRLPERHACPGIITEKRSWDIFSRFRRGALQKPQQPTLPMHSSEPIKPQHEALSESTETHPTKEEPEINEEQEPIETSWTRNEVKPIQHESKLDYEPIPIHDLKPKKESKVVPQKCSRCNITSPLYRCDYCGNFFCDEHILPEDHACKHILEAKHERPTRAHAPAPQEETEPVPQKNLIPLIVRLIAVWALLVGLHQILWLNIHLLREYPILYRIVTGGEYVAILGVIVLIVLLYRHNKRPLGPWDLPKQPNKTNKRLIILIFLTVIIVGSTIPIYFTFKNQKMEINNLHIDPKEVISGSSLNIHVSVSKSVDTYLEHILNSLNDIVGYTEEIELKIDGKTAVKDEINLRFNENMNYVYPLIVKEPGIHVISVGVFSEEFEVLRIAKFEGRNLEIIPNSPWIGEYINSSLRIENIGAIIDDKIVSCYVDDKEIGKTRISLNPEQSTTLSFLFCGDTAGLHKVSFIWEGGNLDGVVSISIPDNPISRPEYYYSLAKDYVYEKYIVPDDKNINGLVEFLDQLEFPLYLEDVFDCSECSSLLEWLLEGAGFHTYIATISNDFVGGHAWVQVELENGIVAIESTQLTRGWALDSGTKPWGIVSKDDGTYEELTYTYRHTYQQFLDWKKTYSSPRYEWDRNITFEEWKAKYLTSLSLPSLGIPSKWVYYSSAVSHELPLEQIIESEGYKTIIFSMDEYDWWNIDPYTNTFPFSEWS